jgi:hypothetical protein
LNSIAFPPIPVETARAARAIFGQGNFYLITGDKADHLFDGLALEEPARLQQPPQTKAMLYLVTIFQFIERLPDSLAADALRKRIDWQYALHLPLTYRGLEASSFCDFRRWLLSDVARRRSFQTILDRWCEIAEFYTTHPAGLEPGAVITTVCNISRLANIWEAIHCALEALARRSPDWLLQVSLPHWFERYGPYHRHLDLTGERLEKDNLARMIGADGYFLLEAISESGDFEMGELDEIQSLRELWHEQFERVNDGTSWRRKACAGCSSLGLSPYSMLATNLDHKEA